MLTCGWPRYRQIRGSVHGLGRPSSAVTAAQVRDVVARLIAAGHWRAGDPAILVVFDSGYDLTRLAWLLADLPVDVTGRLRSDRVMHFPAPPRPARPAGTGGRPPRHGAAVKLADARSWPVPAVTTSTQTTRYGTATAMAWPRLHQRLASRGGWEGHNGDLPVIEGTLIRLAVDHLPGDRRPGPLWLWSSRAAADADAVDRTWQAFLRRFDLSTPSGSSNRSSAGPAQNCVTRPPPTGGPGSSSPATPSSTWPAPSPPASGCPGSGPARPAG